MSHREVPLVFECGRCRLVGIAALPGAPCDIGVLIVVGGPQYRAGSHRQFTLLARDLAEAGIPSLRFDYRGMGDSEGDMRNFEAVDADIRSATDALLAAADGVKKVVIWGLCDAASAALCYAHTDTRVAGLVLLNPWAHTEATESRTRLKHYYLARLVDKSFWLKLFSGEVKIIGSALELGKTVQSLFAKKATPPGNQPAMEENMPYIRRMLTGMQRFQGGLLLILSGNDLVAREFDDLARSDKEWKAAFEQCKLEKHWLEEANHTFSTREHRNQVSGLTRQWLGKLQGQG